MIRKVVKKINNQNWDCIEESCDRCGKTVNIWYVDISIEEVKTIQERYYKWYVHETKEFLCEDCFDAINRCV